MNVKEVVEIVLALNGGEKFDKTCDQLIEGDWEYQVTGVVTTFMATVDVIHRTIKSGYNLIITHEPTYFTGLDHIDWVKDDPVYQRKKALIDDNRISIWRYHDHMHGGNTDLIYAGLLKDLGWKEYLNTELPQPHCYTIPATTVVALVDFLKKTLGMKVIQVVGDPEMKCSRVGILVGGGSLGLGQEEMPARLMHDQQLDVMICGEITEWTLSAYVRDAAALGFGKAMIVVGHERSEEPGMKELANLLQPLLKDIPIRFSDAGEPFIYL
ncbi:MAG: Nif3-like dinuclear metal center hexameric protein [Dehalococcoidales bacterium]|nr:Nif3-like dinuclear metal center hexameric protein [Dehalococcoidales bacterium]